MTHGNLGGQSVLAMRYLPTRDAVAGLLTKAQSSARAQVSDFMGDAVWYVRVDQITSVAETCLQGLDRA